MTKEDALLQLLAELRDLNYHFIAVTPATHARVLGRPRSQPTLRDIFGWNCTFGEHEIEPQLLALLRCSGFIDETDGHLRSRIRVASVGQDLFLHSGFPTDSADAVFLGPDTYRFTRFVARQLEMLPAPAWIVDMGSGSGAGGILATKQVGSARLSLVDLNAAAGRLARLNARFAGVRAEVMVGEQIPQGCNLVIANPPYMIDSAHRTYRDGGAIYGGGIACNWVVQALDALVPAGNFILYTGAAVVGGTLPLLDRIRSLCDQDDAVLHTEEIDPDVFGDELEMPQYREVERIAVLGIRITTR